MSNITEKKRKLNKTTKVDQIIRNDDDQSSAARKKTKIRSTKETRKYGFAPVNNLNSTKKNEAAVLQSISVSQIRNSVNSNDIQTTPNNKSTKIKQQPKFKRVHSYKSESKILPRLNNVGEPLDEVIWKYSPNQKDTSDKANSSQDYSDEVFEILQNLSSTPLVPIKLKSVLNFSNMNEMDDVLQTTTRHTSNNDTPKITSYSNKLTKDRLRDIDQILLDMQENVPLKPNQSRFNELPSSPERMEHSDSMNYNQTTNDAGRVQLNGKYIAPMKNENLIPVSQTIEKKEELNIMTVLENEREIQSQHTVRPSKMNTEYVETVNMLIEQTFTKEDHAEMNQEEEEEEEEEEDDDILINILTQRNIVENEDLNYNKQQRKQSDLKEAKSDEVLDDSLLDFLDTSKPTELSNELSKNVIKSSEIESNDNKKSRSLAEYTSLAQSSFKRAGVRRLVVSAVREMVLRENIAQKILTCIDSEGKTDSIILRNPWVYLDIKEGDVIHVVEGKHSQNKRLLSSDIDTKTQVANDNLLILHPDILLSATTIGGSINCLRSGVIENLFQDVRGEPSIFMTVGNIVHEILQDAFKYKVSHTSITMEYLITKLDSVLVDYSFAIIVCNQTVKQVREDIIETHLSYVFEFVNKYVTKENYGKYISISGTRRTQPISISNVIDIEESIWSHTYGMKGYLDATIEAHVEKNSCIVPLEVKTGKTRSVSHEAQGLIYTLLLSDKYEIPVDFFLLLYTKRKEIGKFPQHLRTVKDILMIRNKLATSLKYRLKEIRSKNLFQLELPPLIKNSMCDMCYKRSQCLTLNKLLEGGSAKESPTYSEDFDLLTSHLNENQKLYKNIFVKYNDLITKEESTIRNINQELFLFDSRTKESRNGHCIANLTVSEVHEDNTQIETYLYKFVRNQDSEIDFNTILHAQIAINDMIIISDEIGHFALCSGYVVAIDKHSITVSAKRKLLNNKIIDKSKNTVTIRSVVDSTIEESQTLATQNCVTYRIDKNDIQQSLSSARFNLLNLFLPPVKPGDRVLDKESQHTRLLKRSEGGDEHIRQLLIDGISPKFICEDEPPLVPYNLPDDINFNVDQMNSIEKCIRAEDFALILGMPGTGKTTVIAELIKILVSANKKILLTSYTHSAVDNILLKLLDSNIDIIRLGSKRNIHPHAQKYIPKYDSVETYEDFLTMINETSLVATTCLGIKDILFSLKEKDFDYVILDEASQVSMPVALGPLRFGDKFIMVGDHKQLPPLIKNETAAVGGLDDSLFKMLSEKHPDSMVELTYQYRMSNDIMKLSNFLIYDDKLKCGNIEVAEQSLEISNIDALSEFQVNNNEQSWLKDVLDPKRKVIFLDYDSNDNILENSDGDNIINSHECELVEQSVEGLVRSGVQCENIGIMTLYRAQLKLLRKQLKREDFKNLEILTTDQFQGRDKECIIISMVRSNKQLNGGSLLKEIRRVNVAMTRAKSKLIIIGSKKTISSIPEIRSFMKMLSNSGWIYQLPKNVLNIYKFPQIEQNTSKIDTQKTHKHIRKGTTKNGAKSIGSDSRILKDKPITRQTLEF